MKFTLFLIATTLTLLSHAQYSGPLNIVNDCTYELYFSSDNLDDGTTYTGSIPIGQTVSVTSNPSSGSAWDVSVSTDSNISNPAIVEISWGSGGGSTIINYDLTLINCDGSSTTSCPFGSSGCAIDGPCGSGSCTGDTTTCTNVDTTPNDGSAEFANCPPGPLTLYMCSS
jgi:hypothetical protein